MSKHNEIGIKGEQAAADFLLNNGYIIVERNWRAAKKEVDIIAFKDNVLAFIEVKTRSRTDLYFPEETVGARKRGHLKTAADIFIMDRPEYRNIRFDIVSVVMDRGEVKEIMHFEEAFH